MEHKGVFEELPYGCSKVRKKEKGTSSHSMCAEGVRK
jgi:hypothetical protein